MSSNKLTCEKITKAFHWRDYFLQMRGRRPVGRAHHLGCLMSYTTRQATLYTFGIMDGLQRHCLWQGLRPGQLRLKTKSGLLRCCRFTRQLPVNRRHVYQAEIRQILCQLLPMFSLRTAPSDRSPQHILGRYPPLHGILENTQPLTKCHTIFMVPLPSLSCDETGSASKRSTKCGYAGMLLNPIPISNKFLQRFEG